MCRRAARHRRGQRRSPRPAPTATHGDREAPAGSAATQPAADAPRRRSTRAAAAMTTGARTTGHEEHVSRAWRRRSLGTSADPDAKSCEIRTMGSAASASSTSSRAGGTVAAVAEALAYSPSSVSVQLAQLEREAGAKLLRRAGRNVELTPAGLPSRRPRRGGARRPTRRSGRSPPASGDAPRGRLRITIVQAPALALLPGLLDRLVDGRSGARGSRSSSARPRPPWRSCARAPSTSSSASSTTARPAPPRRRPARPAARGRAARAASRSSRRVHRRAGPARRAPSTPPGRRATPGPASTRWSATSPTASGASSPRPAPQRRRPRAQRPRRLPAAPSLLLPALLSTAMPQIASAPAARRAPPAHDLHRHPHDRRPRAPAVLAARQALRDTAREGRRRAARDVELLIGDRAERAAAGRG